MATEGHILHAWMANRDWFPTLDLDEMPGADDLSAEQKALLRACREFENRVLGQYSWDEFDPSYRELPLELRSADGELITRGTADRVDVSRANRVIVIDWKFGRVPISPISGALQVGAYAGAALQTFNVPVAEAWIFQPRTKAEYHAQYSSLDAIIPPIVQIDRNTQREDAPLRPSLEACEYCSAAAMCPALREVATAATQTAVQAFGGLPPEERRKVVEVMQLAEDWSSHVKETAKAFLREGGEIPGYELICQPGHRKIEDSLHAWKLVGHVLGAEQFIGALKVSVPGLEGAYATALKAAGKVKTKVDGTKEFNARLASLITRGDNRESLVRVKE